MRGTDSDTSHHLCHRCLRQALFASSCVTRDLIVEPFELQVTAAAVSEIAGPFYYQRLT